MLKRYRDDDGSLIVAMMVLMLVVSLSSTVLARTLIEQHSVRQNQDFNAALASADGGLSDALFQLDQPANSGQTITSNGTSGGGTWSYTATPLDSQDYSIRARGTVNGRSHDVMAKVSRSLLFDYGMFSVQSISMSGDCTGSVSSPLGSDGSIDLTGPGGTCGVHEDCYKPGTGPCPAAPDGRTFNTAHPEPDPTVPSGTTTACPTSNPTFSGTVSGGGGVPYVCSSGSVTFGNVTVSNGPLIIYVTSTATVDLGCNTINGGSGGTSPAVNFQLYIVPTVSWTWNGCGPDISGGIYAPHASLTANGGKLNIKGRIVANSITIHGAPNTFASDTSLDQLVTSNWKVSSYHEVATSCTTSC
jgi:hypothetical protein